MRGPNDDALQAQLDDDDNPPFDGSKAARRLAFFRDQRGLARPESAEEQAARAEAGAAEGAEASSAQVDDEAYAQALNAAYATLSEAQDELIIEAAAEEPELMAVTAEEAPEGEAGAEAEGEAAEEPEARDVTSLPAGPIPFTLVPRWRSVGPRRMDNGQTYGDTRVPVTGRVSAVAVDPRNRNNILVGAAGGGVWQSTNGGTHWRPRTDYAPALATGAIAFDPSTPGVVYVGTGEGDFYWTLGQGILKSTNGGASFTHLVGAPFIGKGFHSIVVDPGNASHLLVGTTHGLYRSTDGGSVWSRRISSRCWSISATRSGRSFEALAACANGLHRSTTGNSWSAVTLPGAPASFNRFAVAHAPSRPEVAYAFGASGGTAYLWMRGTTGTWRRIGLPSTLRTNQAWYDWFLAVSPDRHTQIYFGAIEAWRGDSFGFRWLWTRISNKTGDDIHPDQHAIAFDPVDPSRVYIGCDGGLYRSNDRGTNWDSLNDGLYITEIEYMAHDPGSARWLLAGTQDNGTNRYRGSHVWDHVADGDGGDCGVNQINPDTVFHTYYGMGVRRSTSKGDFGTYTSVGPPVPSGYRRLFYPPFESRGHTIAQAGESVWVSRNNGTNWVEVNLPGSVTASAMHAPDANNLYVGTTSGELFRITWNGSSWSTAQTLTSARAGAYVSDIYVNARNRNHIWVTSSRMGGGRAFVSTNGGASWTDRSAGLPNLPINAVVVDPANGNRVWVAADLGVYETRNGGTNWHVFGLGLPNVLVADLLFHPHARLLRAGTRNRGVFQIPVDGDMRVPICRRQFTGTVPPHSARRWYTFNWPATWHMVWTVMPTTVRRGAPQLSWNVQVEKANAERLTYWITVRNHTPVPVSFEGRYCILSRY